MSDGIAELTALVAQLGSMYTEAAAKLKALSTREPYRSMVVEGGGIRRRRFYRSKVMLYINGGQGHE